MTQRQMRKHPAHTLWESEASVFTVKQNNLSDNNYYEKFKDIIMNAERLGGEIGVYRTAV